jgi:hypothetical protein
MVPTRAGQIRLMVEVFRVPALGFRWQVGSSQDLGQLMQGFEQATDLQSVVLAINKVANAIDQHARAATAYPTVGDRNRAIIGTAALVWAALVGVVVT